MRAQNSIGRCVLRIGDRSSVLCYIPAVGGHEDDAPTATATRAVRDEGELMAAQSGAAHWVHYT